MPETKVKRVFFVRHGETELNTQDVCQFHETPLSEHGHTQARMLADRCAHLSCQRLITSDMERAMQTAKYIAEELRLPAEGTRLLRERMLPEELRGRPRASDEYRRYQEDLRVNFHDLNWRPKGAENFSDLMARADSAEAFILGSDAENILAVTHSAFMKLLVMRMLLRDQLTPLLALHFDYALSVKNTAITGLIRTGDTWRLITWNDHAHFAE